MPLYINSFLGAQFVTTETPDAFTKIRYRLATAHIDYTGRAASLAVPAGNTHIVVEYRLGSEII